MFASLIKKDLREHGLVFVLCTLGFLMVVLISAVMNTTGSFSVSPIEIVRFSLITVLPLLGFIAGSRLIVDEYLGRTRLFVEALPVSRSVLILEKFLVGWLYLLFVAFLGLTVAVLIGGPGDEMDRRALLVIGSKTAAMVSLIWSIVFCFSLTGYLRLFFYLLLFVSISLLLWYPGVNQDVLGPFRLMNNNVFSYERTDFPWRALAETLLITVVFTVAGFYLALSNDGSLAEKLSKRLSRREFVILGISLASLLVLFSTLLDMRPEIPRMKFSGDHVIRQDTPPISILYLYQSHKEDAQKLMDDTAGLLESMQSALGVSRLPETNIALKPGLAFSDLELDSSAGVFARVDFVYISQFERNRLLSIVLHDTFQNLSNRRVTVERYHWILDGFSRWWVEKTHGSKPMKDKMLAQSITGLRQLPKDFEYFAQWQILADRVGYPVAELMAYSAFIYLEEIAGEQTIIELAQEFLVDAVPMNSLTTLNEYLDPYAERFRRITGLPLDEFMERWEVWLEYSSRSDPVRSLVKSYPVLNADIKLVWEERSPVIQVVLGADQVKKFPDNTRCYLTHRRIHAFDTEMILGTEDRHELSCHSQDIQEFKGPYSRGDRLYLTVDMVLGQSLAPLRLKVDRINLQ